ncbi:MAG: SH3 domain-containing protein [Okeania sp. SIO2F4]|uniref:SH3 domain-containing protein n=1 Tax=Okeania sp. SIO2F4 TaxID=2607790 RepID=UPI00142C6E0C|nr:SH3 domain-containing protein [Okeania sp. SIO2F4]NES05836.1 SH3 domain-containing protein [Okeania sp. SIO2F4]
MNLYGFFKFLVGFILAILLLAGASAAAVLYFAAKLTRMPEKPIFQNEKPVVQKVSTSPQATNSKNQLEPGSYRAVVIEPIGLILRDTPSRNSNRIGGISYQEEVIVLEESSDKRWQKVRVDDGSDRIGWVSGGNTERLD